MAEFGFFGFGVLLVRGFVGVLGFFGGFQGSLGVEWLPVARCSPELF